MQPHPGAEKLLRTGQVVGKVKSATSLACDHLDA